MAFKVKDLMINIAPGEDTGPGQWTHNMCPPPCGCTVPHSCRPTLLCEWSDTNHRHPTNLYRWQQFNPYCGETYFCEWSTTPLTITHLTPTLCPGATVAGPVGVPPGGDPAMAAEQLAMLKMQLKQALAEIESQEKTLNESLEPKTVAEVEILQGKLKDALVWLEARKKALQKKD